MSGSSGEETDSVEYDDSAPLSILHYFPGTIDRKCASSTSAIPAIQSSIASSAAKMDDIIQYPSAQSAADNPSAFQGNPAESGFVNLVSSISHLPHQQNQITTTTSFLQMPPESQQLSIGDTNDRYTRKQTIVEFTKLKPKAQAVSLSHTEEEESCNLGNPSFRENNTSPIDCLNVDSSIFQTTSLQGLPSLTDPEKQILNCHTGSSNIKTSLKDLVFQSHSSVNLHKIIRNQSESTSSNGLSRSPTGGDNLPHSSPENVTKNKSKPDVKLVATTPALARISVEAVSQEADSSGSIVTEPLGLYRHPKASVNKARCNRNHESSVTAQHQLHPDGNTVESGQPAHMLCKVCVNDKASGLHYGVSSCEGCKSFYRRSLHNDSYLNFKCQREGKCMVVRMTRNRCQYCRFKKCQEVGMSRDAVRYGRLPPGNKRERRASEEGGQGACSEVQQQMYRTVESIVRVSAAYHAHFDTTADRMAGIKRTQYSLIPDDSDCVDLRAAMFEELAAMMEDQLKRVIAFAKSLPGFVSLSQASQLSLLKAGFLPTWLLHINRLFDIKEQVLVMPDGRYITKEELDYTLTADVSKYLFNLSQTLTTQLSLNDTEVALLTALTLLNPEHSCQTDEREARQAHHKLQECLRVQLSRKHKDVPDLYDNLITFKRELTFVATLFRNQVTKFKVHHFKLPGLFVEMFDLSPF